MKVTQPHHRYILSTTAGDRQQKQQQNHAEDYVKSCSRTDLARSASNKHSAARGSGAKLRERGPK